MATDSEFSKKVAAEVDYGFRAGIFDLCDSKKTRADFGPVRDFVLSLPALPPADEVRKQIAKARSQRRPIVEHLRSVFSAS